MKFNIFLKTLLLTTLSLYIFQACSKNSSKPQINHIKGVTIDGNNADWIKKGSSFSLISDKFGIVDTNDFKANLKIGWDSTGLYFFATIKDDIVQCEKGSKKRQDQMEIFISLEKGSDKMVQYLFSNLLTKDSSKIMINKFDYRLGIPLQNVNNELNTEVKRTKDGYNIEIFIPSERIGDNLTQNKLLFINACIDDADKDKLNKYPLFINNNSYTNHFALKDILLSNVETENTDELVSRIWTVDKKNIHIQLVSAKNHINKNVQIKENDNIIISGKYKKYSDYSICNIEFEKSKLSNSTTGFEIISDKNPPSHYYFREIPMLFVNLPKLNNFEETICMFEEMDKVSPPPKNAVLFIGSSTIRLWRSLEEDFEGINVIKRGFGGSKTTDALYYFDRIVKPYHPKTIVYFSGNNDINLKLTPEKIVANIRTFIEKVNTELPGTNVLILSVKASISRKNTLETVYKINDLLKIMIKEFPNAEYVDVIRSQFNQYGKLNTSIFSADGTHMNAKGYKRWSDIVSPYLVK